MQNISNKVALITGGSKGIGYGIAEALVNKGVKVAITSRSQSSADEAAKSLGGPDKVLALEADVRSFESQQSCVTKIIEKWGQLDYVIANAGLGHFASVADLSADQWNEVIDTNLTGPFYTIKSSLEALKSLKDILLPFLA